MQDENDKKDAPAPVAFLGRFRKDKYLLILGVFVVLMIFSALLIFHKGSGSQAGGTTSKSTSTTNAKTATASPSTTKAASAEILPTTSFANGLGNWYEEVWYKAVSSGGEVTTGAAGVTFKAVKADSRSGIMLDLNKDISGFKKVTLAASVTAKSQTLTGTGWNGREAPVAVAVSYVDASGVDHSLLGEDPKAAGQMFWRGFYYLDPTGQSGAVNGVKVTQNQPYNFTFDLMTLNPKPKTIKFVSLEGAGWQSREGSVSAISITGE